MPGKANSTESPGPNPDGLSRSGISRKVPIRNAALPFLPMQNPFLPAIHLLKPRALPRLTENRPFGFLPALICLLFALKGVAADNRPIDVNAYPPPIRVACAGDSITAGVGA